ncbi:RING-H2 finger protein ATL74-like [Cucurbita maxima]|uniref:RING-type E3 ubiquitin transferase n=1 Tax=Cucurbita maxima TaxID=3661 RepID=A0A6J1I6E6_CUCMA|nr:RING-H2 finger protein ATL74-like [Cucurbita maxima]
MDPNLPRRLLATEAVQGNTTANSSYYVGEMNLDAHMVVILAALLFALIGALGVNALVRCVLSLGFRFRTERPEETAARLAAIGLKKRELSQIPVGVYGSDCAKIKGTDCAICLGEFEVGDKVRMLPICNHGFHVRCIDTWLLSHSSCPNCRHSLLLPPVKGKRDAVTVSPAPPPPRGSASSHVVVVVEGGGN